MNDFLTNPKYDVPRSNVHEVADGLRRQPRRRQGRLATRVEQETSTCFREEGKDQLAGRRSS